MKIGNGIDDDRAEYLSAKYGLNQPPQRENTILTTLLMGELLSTELNNWRPGEKAMVWLFDEANNPDLAAVAARHLADLRAGLLDKTIAPLSAVGCAEVNHRHDTIWVHVPGSPRLATVKATERDVAAFAQSFQATWRAVVDGLTGRHCEFKLAGWCDDQLQFWPHHVGVYLLLIPACGQCRQHATISANDGHILNAITAHESLRAAPELPPAPRSAPAAGLEGNRASPARTGLMGLPRLMFTDLWSLIRRLWVVLRCR